MFVKTASGPLLHSSGQSVMAHWSCSEPKIKVCTGKTGPRVEVDVNSVLLCHLIEFKLCSLKGEQCEVRQWRADTHSTSEFT